MRGAHPRRYRLARVACALASALLLALAGATTTLACTTALSPRPLADYRAATPVVLGTVEKIGPAEISVQVEVVYRGRVGSRLRLVLAAWPNVTRWCAFPSGPPVVGDRVLVAVVDPAYWEWPNAAFWTVDARGRIVSPPEAPWSGAPAPTTVDEALRAMGIEAVPDTALGPAVVAERGVVAERDAPPTGPIDLVPWLAGCAWMVGWLRRRTGPAAAEPPARQNGRPGRGG